jgi:penicillin-binding protein 1A
VWLLRSALAGVLLTVLGLIAVVLVVRHHAADLPSVAELKAGYNPPQVTRVLARDGTLLKAVFTERRTVVPFDEISAATKLAFLAAEDAHFYEHEGLNYWGILRAVVRNLRAGGARQGGSTITQQVVKNVLLDSSRTLRRKIRETILARQLEQHLSKDEILWLYLNHIYLGHGRYGIEEAARYYFGKKARDLRLDEAATLAGLVAAPERFSPRKDRAASLRRRSYVLQQMLAKGFVTPQLFAELQDAPLLLAPASDTQSELCPEIVSVAEDTLKVVAGEASRQGGYTVTTTIDPELQAAARQAVRDNLDSYARRHRLQAPFIEQSRELWGKPFQGEPRVNGIYVGVVDGVDDQLGTIDVQVGSQLGTVQLRHDSRYNPQHLLPSQFTREGAVLRVQLMETPIAGSKPALQLELGPQSALVALDVRTREVLALVGGYEGTAGGLDRTTQARRQPGSTFKAVTYSYALHSRRFTPATVLQLPPEKKPSKPPKPNRMSVRVALAESDNRAAVLVFKQSGPANVVEWGHKLGIESRLQPDESLALGSYEVTPFEFANVYATFASGGERVTPVLIQSIVGARGPMPVPTAKAREQVMPADEAYLTTSLLRSVVELGTGRAAQSLGRPVAGKTGTTNRAKDAWFIGYSTEIVTAVWVGYDDALPLGFGEAGSKTALPAWISFMKRAHDKRPATEFPRPASIVAAQVDPRTGWLPYPGQTDSVSEEFLDGTVPSEIAVPDAGAPSPVADPDLDVPLNPDTIEPDTIEPEAIPPETIPGATVPSPTPRANPPQ